MSQIKIYRADGTDVSPIVVTLNTRVHDAPVYDKHKFSLDEISEKLERWLVAREEGGSRSAHAYIYIDGVNLTDRVAFFKIFLINYDNTAAIIRECVSFIFKRFNVDKVSTEILYDRSDLIKKYIAIGGSIEVRKRAHLYSGGRYNHIVEVAVFKNEFRY